MKSRSAKNVSLDLRGFKCLSETKTVFSIVLDREETQFLATLLNDGVRVPGSYQVELSLESSPNLLQCQARWACHCWWPAIVSLRLDNQSSPPTFTFTPWLHRSPSSVKKERRMEVSGWTARPHSSRSRIAARDSALRNWIWRIGSAVRKKTEQQPDNVITFSECNKMPVWIGSHVMQPVN